jgi:hypothetical protein
VLFTDESKVRCRRTAGKFKDNCVIQTVQFEGVGAIVWGAMTYRGAYMLTRVDG